jgi:hypothetical protein
MADQYLSPTPYANQFTGYSNDMIQGLLGYMKDKQRTQQMQGLAGLLESTGIPQIVERSAYAQSPKALLDALTNVNRANVPLLKAETADALMTVVPVGGVTARAAERGAMAAGRAGERLAERVVPQVMERGGKSAQLLEDLGQGTRRQIFVPATPDEALKASRLLKTKTPEEVWQEIGVGKFGGEYQKELSDQAARFNTAEDIAANAQKIKERNLELKQTIKESQSTYPDLFPKELTAARRPLREEIKANQNMLERNFGYEANPAWAGQLAQIAYEHPSLYTTLPELKGAVIRQGRNAGDALRGSYEEPARGGAGLLEITKKGLAENPRSIATHEMQHAVQGLADWERGGMPDEFLRAAMQEREQIYAKITDLNKEMSAAVGTPKYEGIMNERMMLVKELQAKGYDDMSSIESKAYDQYQKLAGEAQARLAQTRLDLSEADRRKYFPFQYGKENYGLDVRPEDLIYRRGLLEN